MIRDLLPIIAAVSVFLALGAGVLAMAAVGIGGDDGRHRRLEALKRRWPGFTAPEISESIKRDGRDSSIARLDRLIKRLLPQPEKLRRRLRMTGRPIRLGPYLLANGLLAVSAAWLLNQVMPLPWLVNSFAGILAGLGLPWFIVGWMISRRLGKFNAQFPDAIDLIVRGLRSGLPVSEAIKSVGEEMADPVGVEFRGISEVMRIGRTLEEGLWEAAARFNTADFKFFVVTLSIQKETGGNLAETLGHLSDLLRKRRQMKLKIRAMSSEARASAYILGGLPFIMFAIIFTLNQGYAMSLFTDPRGMILIGFCALMMLMGAGVMAKMVRFEI